MTSRKKLLFSSISGVVFGLMADIGTMPAAQAMCVTGAQCKLEDGSIVDIDNIDFVNGGEREDNAHLYASNQSSINAKNIILKSPHLYGYYATHAKLGGVINLEDSYIKGGHGLYATGKGSQITMRGGRIDSFREAIYLSDGATAVLENVDITIGAPPGAPLCGQDPNNPSSPANPCSATYGIVTSAWYADSHLTIIGGSITHARNARENDGSGAAINAGRGLTSIDGTKITSSKEGILVSSQPGGRARLEMKGGFSIETAQHSGTGIDVNNWGEAKVEKGYIHTKGAYAHGIMVVGNKAQLEASEVTIVTEGTQAHGVMNYANSSRLENVDITVNTAFGIYADGVNVRASDPHQTLPVIDMKGGSITVNGAGGSAALAAAKGKIILDKVQLTTVANNNIGFRLFKGTGSFSYGNIDIQGGSSKGVMIYNNSQATMDNSTIETKGKSSQGVYISHDSDGLIDKSHIKVTGADSHGIYAGSRGSVTISDSQIEVSGKDSLGLVFVGVTAANKMVLDHSSVKTQDSFAIVANGGTNTLDVINDSRIEGEKLIFAGNYEQNNTIYGSVLDVNAHNSQLFGRSMVADESTLSMNLGAGSVWTLRPSAMQLLQPETRSDISFLNIEDSAVVFDPNQTSLYQTLFVGSGDLKGRTDVYRAGNNASISLNSYLNKGGTLDQQSTDRLLINGDVSGVTTVNIYAAVGSPGGDTSVNGDYLNNEGISIIQVSGKAEEGSFVLKGGYVTLGGLPYIYKLYAYGAGSSYGEADASQRLVTGSDPHWDYRLQSEAVAPPPPVTPPAAPPAAPPVTPPPAQPPAPPLVPPSSPTVPSRVKAIVGQMSAYLVAPTALFQAQSMDMGTLHQRLGYIRHQLAYDADEGRGEFFWRAYGGDFDYQSHLSALNYGYDATIRYKAMQAGANLYGFDGAGSQFRFGLSGSYGDLNFKPKAVDGVHATDMDVWSLSPYLTWQHDGGAYVDVIVSYGGFEGAVSTATRGQTARLQGHMVAASLEAGVPFVLPSLYHLTIEPQMQLTWQKLEFERKIDIDGFAVALGNPQQAALRAGFKLQQHFVDGAGGFEIRPYATIHLKHGFNDDNKAWFGDDFALGSAGTHLEIGGGLEARMAGKLHAYGAVNWQNHLSHAGTTGWQLKGGLRLNL